MVKASTEHPNVIVFFTDQQRWDTSGLHGNPLDLTPNFNRMALRSTHIYYSFTPQPVCGPVIVLAWQCDKEDLTTQHFCATLEHEHNVERKKCHVILW
jgi:hypothetical protein